MGFDQFGNYHNPPAFSSSPLDVSALLLLVSLSCLNIYCLFQMIFRPGWIPNKNVKYFLIYVVAVDQISVFLLGANWLGSGDPWLDWILTVFIYLMAASVMLGQLDILKKFAIFSSWITANRIDHLKTGYIVLNVIGYIPFFIKLGSVGQNDNPTLYSIINLSEFVLLLIVFLYEEWHNTFITLCLLHNMKKNKSRFERDRLQQDEGPETGFSISGYMRLIAMLVFSVTWDTIALLVWACGAFISNPPTGLLIYKIAMPMFHPSMMAIVFHLLRNVKLVTKSQKKSKLATLNVILKGMGMGRASSELLSPSDGTSAPVPNTKLSEAHHIRMADTLILDA
ncbi:hypothetical protein HDV03_000835 [Kappamyces sp. JEL0829]|nr:hypothetical protein HDV03_000835 [Kappamyces sp. JEL0829]